ANSIQGGVQKNIGIAGISLVILRKSLLPPNISSPAPAFLHQLQRIGGLPGPITYDYAITAKNNSLYNTLPLFNLYVAGSVIASLAKKHNGDIGSQEAVSTRKAQKVYSVLEKYPSVFRIVPAAEVRSRMNICFRVHDEEADAADKEKAFFTGAEKRGLLGIKGHRSVGGGRISNYNAVTEESIDTLCQYLEEYAAGQA
ncbi:Phosphoserine aminotransferase, partial [Ascosphaera atra]